MGQGKEILLLVSNISKKKGKEKERKEKPDRR